MTIRRRAELFWAALKRHHRGKTLGASLGLLGGWFGSAIGFVIGAMIDALLSQRMIERSIAGYLENPGPSTLVERIPGSAAFSALAALVLDADGALETQAIVRSAREAFLADEEAEAELESFARAAAAMPERLNADLLAESLRARRKRSEDDEDARALIGGALIGLASGRRARDVAVHIAEQLFPETVPQKRLDGDDPYTLLGVSSEATNDEVKAAYRQLAVQFHPDASIGLSDRQKESAAEAFMRIDGAYRSILERRGVRSRKGA